MSEQPNEEIELPPPVGDAAFASLMDTLVKDETGEKAGEGETPAAPAASADGGSDAKGGEAGAPATPAGTAADPAGGDTPPATDGPDNKDPAGGAGDTGGDAGPPAGDRPAAWTSTAAELAPKITQLSTAFEERTVNAYQQTALDEVKTEHKQYFDALEKHPRTLVGVTVPSIGKEGNEKLKDATDAKDWQDAVKQLLVGEVRDRASKAMDESKDFLATVHASIELFQKNHDLIPGTKDFDVELANRFATMAAPYELRVDEKLQGYSIDVQPIIEQMRKQLVAERAAKPAVPAPPSPEAGAVAPPADPPQAGVPSKAGASSEAEDFSTLFGTIGLPNLRI